MVEITENLLFIHSRTENFALQGKDEKWPLSISLHEATGFRPWSFIETKGFSMWPFLKTGEKLIIKSVPAGDLKIGDIILYKADNQALNAENQTPKTKNQLVCHRLVKKVACGSGYLLYTWGDASPNLGEPITEKELVGKVTGILRRGRVINFTGRWRQFVNRLIVEFNPFLRIGIKAIIYTRSLARRWRSR